MEEKKRILVVEDDDTIALGIQVFLEKNHFIVIHRDTLQGAKEEIGRNPYLDLVVLDLNLPDGSGYDLCTWIKKQADIPIVFLTVRDEERDMVQGLDIGADDYITKPFQLRVLLSRIRAVLRRSTNRQEKKVLTCGAVTVDKERTLVRCGDQEIPLTAGEYRLLLMLVENKNQTLTRAVLLQKLWDMGGSFVNDNTLTVTMKRLREKLGDTGMIKTIRGIGYRAEDGHE